MARDFERLFVDKHTDGRILMEVDESRAIVFSKEQAQQLIIDLQALVNGDVPEDEASVPGVS